MAHVRLGALIDRAVAAGARVTGSPDWPYVAAGVLGFLAMMEVVSRPQQRRLARSVTGRCSRRCRWPLVRIPLGPAMVMVTTATLLMVVRRNLPTPTRGWGALGPRLLTWLGPPPPPRRVIGAPFISPRFGPWYAQ